MALVRFERTTTSSVKRALSAELQRHASRNLGVHEKLKANVFFLVDIAYSFRTFVGGLNPQELHSKSPAE